MNPKTDSSLTCACELLNKQKYIINQNFIIYET
jgi:hypothetical protein